MELTPGIIVVIQTFGRASMWNPHLHMLVTEGGLDKDGRWQRFYWFDYEILRKKWMYNLLGMIKEQFSGDEEVMRRVEEIWERRKDIGLIVRAKKEKVRKRGIVQYLIRYVSSPPMALSRIEGYDGEFVEYRYREHPTGREVRERVNAYEFILRLIQHIPEGQFKMVRRFGLYSRRKVKVAREILAEVFAGSEETRDFQVLDGLEISNNYRERIIRDFGKDPFLCDKCGGEMILWRIWHPKYGDIYYIDDRFGEIINEDEEILEEEKGEEQLQLFAA